MLGLPSAMIEKVKNEKAINSFITVDDLFIVAKALEKAISKDVFTKEELTVVGKAWNKQMSECQRLLRQGALEKIITREEPSHTEPSHKEHLHKEPSEKKQV